MELTEHIPQKQTLRSIRHSKVKRILSAICRFDSIHFSTCRISEHPWVKFDLFISQAFVISIEKTIVLNQLFICNNKEMVTEVSKFFIDLIYTFYVFLQSWS